MTEKSKANEHASSDGLAKRGVLKLNLRDEDMLYACYMPYIKGCGIFVPSKQEHALGDEVFILVNLPGNGGKFAVSAKVVWLNPRQKMGRRVPGFGLQILGRDAGKMRQKIEDILGKRIKSPSPTATM